MEKDSDKKGHLLGFRKKSFDELSDTAKFHLAPKLFGEDAMWPFYESDLLEIRESIRGNVLEKGEAPTSLSTPEGRHMEKVIHEALAVELEEAGKNDPEEKRKLEACKDKIRHYARVVLESIKVYMGTILFLEEAAKRGYKTEIESADRNRTMAHNALIENVNILNRSLRWWLGKFDPGTLTDSQMEMYEKQEDAYVGHQFHRIEIPPNGICSTHYSIENREEVNRWAKAIYKDLIVIKKLSGLVD